MKREWDANRHLVACPAQTNSSTETGDSSTDDDDFHDDNSFTTATGNLQ